MYFHAATSADNSSHKPNLSPSKNSKCLQLAQNGKVVHKVTSAKSDPPRSTSSSSSSSPSSTQSGFQIPRAGYLSAPNLLTLTSTNNDQPSQQGMACYNELTLMKVASSKANNLEHSRNKETESEHYSDVNVRVEYINNTKESSKSDPLSYYLDYLLFNANLNVARQNAMDTRRCKSSNNVCKTKTMPTCCTNNMDVFPHSTIITNKDSTNDKAKWKMNKTQSDNLLSYKQSLHCRPSASSNFGGKVEQVAASSVRKSTTAPVPPSCHSATTSSWQRLIGCSSYDSGIHLAHSHGGKQRAKMERKLNGTRLPATVPTITTTTAIAPMLVAKKRANRKMLNQVDEKQEEQQQVEITVKNKKKRKHRTSQRLPKPILEDDGDDHGHEANCNNNGQSNECSMCGFSVLDGPEKDFKLKPSTPSMNSMPVLPVKVDDQNKIRESRKFKSSSSNGMIKKRMLCSNLSSSSKTALNLYPPQKAVLSQQNSLAARSLNSFRESFRFTRNFNYFNRNRSDSIAMPANELCNECRCVASAVSAAARHRNALRREESSRLRQEKKAARQLGVILGAFILCWMPYIITYIVTAYCTYCVSLTVHQVTIWLGYFNSFLNPFLYALCNENFKNAFKKMLGRGTPPQHFSYNFDQQTIDRGMASGSTGNSKRFSSFRWKFRRSSN